MRGPGSVCLCGPAKVVIVLLICLHQATYTLSATGTEQPQRMWEPGSNSLFNPGVVDKNSVNNNIALENVTVTNQTAQLGTTAFLHCQVRSATDKQFPFVYQQVSWIRRRDYHLLTSGLQVYSKDERFGVVRSEDTDDWALQVKFVQQRDQGAYECQVSTVTGRYGYLVNLAVVVPEAVISGSTEKHIQAGSTLSLTCVIQGGVMEPQFILWYHDGEMVNYDQSRGGTSVTMDPEDPTTSHLTITTTTSHHAGNYTCTAANVIPASVNIFVTKGDKTAAIQRLGSGGRGLSCERGTTLVVLLVVLATQVLHSTFTGVLLGSNT